MKKIWNGFLDLIDYENIDFISFMLMIIWSISPIVEYISKFFIKKYISFYFVSMIYLIGIVGILVYIIYLGKIIKDKKFHLKDIIPQLLILSMLIIAFISSLLSSNMHLSFYGNTYRKEGLFVYIMYIGFILASSTIKDEKYKIDIFKTIIFSACFITIVPYFLGNFKYTGFTNIFSNTNHYAYYLMIATSLSGLLTLYVSKYKKILYYLIYIFLLYVLIMNNTFGCYLALFISLLCLLVYSLIKKKRRINALILLVSFVLLSFFVSHYNIQLFSSGKEHTNIVSNNINTFTNDIKKSLDTKDKNHEKAGSGRIKLWKGAISYTLDHPIFGGGMECLDKYYFDTYNSTIGRPHNIFLQISSFIGIPGAIIYLALILYLAKANLKNLLNPINIIIYFTAMSYFISSMFGNSMYYTSPYFMILLGLLIGMKNSMAKLDVKK